MTGPQDSHGSTRPISVAELLAKNGTIGAPPVGGRRRRRRGDSDAVTVAELTGEIPIVRDDIDDVDRDVDDAETTSTLPVVSDESVVEMAAPSSNGAERTRYEDTADDYAGDYPDDDYADAVADYAAHVEEREVRDVDADLDFFAPPRRSSFAPRRFRAAESAERMSPDPVEDEAALDSAVDETDPADVDEYVDYDVDEGLDRRADRDELPSYLRSSAGPLFGGHSVADDMARRELKSRPEDRDLETREDLEDDEDTEQSTAMSSVTHAAWIVGQCVLAVAFGAGLFVAFDQLWKWNSIVALVLGVLVILGLVAGVRVVRKTEDIGSTLIAVAVGAMVTFGPLALLQAG